MHYLPALLSSAVDNNIHEQMKMKQKPYLSFFSIRSTNDVWEIEIDNRNQDCAFVLQLSMWEKTIHDTGGLKGLLTYDGLFMAVLVLYACLEK